MVMLAFRSTLLAALAIATTASLAAEPATAKIIKHDLLPPGPGNPRNSEGDFITLDDGRVLFIYTHFTGGAGDASAAHLASRASSDGGRTWTKQDETVIKNEADQNIMSVSLVRLTDGRVALFYLQKESHRDCRPVVRFSSDEAQTWSKPHPIVPDSEVGYYVMNNDRVLQLDDGRLIAPLGLHRWKDDGGWNPSAQILCYISDDAGLTWRRGKPVPVAKEQANVVLQEPGLVPTSDDRILIYCRTNAGHQYGAFSEDGGITWANLQPLPLPSPLSPAKLERIPGQPTILAVWNDHQDVPEGERTLRTPLTLAVATDPTKPWARVLTLEDNPHGWFCYTAMHFVDDAVLLGYCGGDRRENNGLAFTKIARIPLAVIKDSGTAGGN